MYSGYVIARYCPKPELGLPMRTGTMWLLYAVIAMASPIALVLARRWMAKGMTRQGVKLQVFRKISGSINILVTPG